MDNEEILNLKIDNDDFDNGETIKDYLHTLLTKIWGEGEGFNGKRPFGNSSWEFDLYKPLIKAGVVEGTLDEYGYVDEINTDHADQLVFELIDYIFL